MSPADAITVANELTRRGEIGRVGGAPYLHTLIASVPTAANAGYYARIVRERSILRRLVEAGTRIVQFGYAGEAEADDLVDRAQAEVYAITDHRVTEDYHSLADIMPGALDEIEAIGSHGDGMTGVPTGFADFDSLTNGLHPGQMVVIAARPAVGKSTLALDFARSAAIKNGLSTAFFSLEMGRNEITMRLLSAEAKVSLQTMRTGQMSDDDWARLARRMSEVADAPLFIDDSPNMSMMEIRSKCRRLKQRHDLRLVIIDYLQLMSSPKRVENRQQEVSEMSRSLKLLAKEIDVPVIALSQLNRGPEQRTDKKPLLSDLRESGCLTGDTRILRADTGAEVTLSELLASGERDVPVWSLDERLRLVPRTMTHAFPSGTKEVFQVRLRSGRLVRATANHPFLTYDGWRPLGNITVGSRVAVPRHTPGPLAVRPMPEPEIIMLAHLLGDGSFVRSQPIRYASTDEANLAAVATAAQHFGITPARDDHAAARCTSLRLPAPYRLARGRRNPIAEWLERVGLYGLRSHEKFIPAPVFSLPKQQAALFVRHLWATDGCVWWDATAGHARIYYASTSRRMIDNLARLLLRFNVMTRVKEVSKGTYRPCYHLLLYGAETNALLILARADEGHLAIQAEAVDVADLLADVAARWQAVVETRNVNLEMELPDQGVVQGDPMLLARLLDNLMDNACRYTPARGSIWLAAEPDESGWHLSVSNTGAGIAPELRDEIFERFRRGDPSRTRETGGAGLGLALCQTIARLHGGVVAPRSAVAPCHEVHARSPLTGAVVTHA